MKMSLCLKLDLTLEWLDAGMLEGKTVGSDHTGIQVSSTGALWPARSGERTSWRKPPSRVSSRPRGFLGGG
jgi:hypothetical protein